MKVSDNGLIYTFKFVVKEFSAYGTRFYLPPTRGINADDRMYYTFDDLE